MHNPVVSYYAAPDIAPRIISATGRENPTIDDLGPYDEFHSGGRAATLDIMARMQLNPDMRILDLGCGVGGAARVFAAKAGVQVTGVDLSPDYIAAAQELSALTGLSGKTRYQPADVLSLPFSDCVYDAAYTLHVGMNIRDKQAFYSESFRVLKPGSIFAVYDIMAGPVQAQAHYPLPWADAAEISFLIPPVEAARTLARAGFIIAADFYDMTALAAAGLDRALATGFNPPVMGEDAAVKMMNLASGFANRTLVAGCILARKQAS